VELGKVSTKAVRGARGNTMGNTAGGSCCREGARVYDIDWTRKGRGRRVWVVAHRAKTSARGLLGIRSRLGSNGRLARLEFIRVDDLATVFPHGRKATGEPKKHQEYNFL
jgi:hypothetical protein